MCSFNSNSKRIGYLNTDFPYVRNMQINTYILEIYFIPKCRWLNICILRGQLRFTYSILIYDSQILVLIICSYYEIVCKVLVGSFTALNLDNDALFMVCPFINFFMNCGSNLSVYLINKSIRIKHQLFLSLKTLLKPAC